MKISFIGHASILVETRGVRVLSDPWWRGPCFGAQWWTYPEPKTSPVQAGVNFIYISHGHHDHLHPGTLKTLDRRVECLVSRQIGIAPALREIGFGVTELGDDDVLEVAPNVRCRIIETHTCDTLCVLDDGERVCLNLNDALHAAPAHIQDTVVARLRAMYPRIDYVFCGYGVASHFPNCYAIPGKNRDATASRRQSYFNAQWSRLIAGLQPRYAFPFAADVALLEDDLIWSNEPTHNPQRPTDLFRSLHPGSATTVVDIAPGFVIEDDRITSSVLRQPTSLARIRAECAEQIERANAYGTAAENTFDEVLKLVADNVARCLPYLREHRGDYRFLLRFRNYPSASIAIVKRGTKIRATAVGQDDGSYDIVYFTRLHYLRFSLTTPYGHEILLVGSGGIFHYQRAADVRRNLHRELATILVPHDMCPASRFGDASRLVYWAKRRLRALVRPSEPDLYDLAAWTEWETAGSRARNAEEGRCAAGTP